MIPIRVFKIIFVIFLAIFQISFLDNLPVFWRELNLFLLFLAFSLEIGAISGLFLAALSAGFVFDLYSFLPFGFFLIFWPVIFILMNFLSKSFLTNRSLYSFLGLVFLSFIFYIFLLNLSLWALAVAAGGQIVFFAVEKSFWLSTVAGAAVNLVVAAIIFYVFSIFNKKFRPIFIKK